MKLSFTVVLSSKHIYMNVCASEFEKKMGGKWENGQLIFEAPAWSSWKIPDKLLFGGIAIWCVNLYYSWQL